MTMDTPAGSRQMWFTGEYREVVEPTRLVYSEAMSDEDGTILSAAEMGMPDGFPTVTEVRVDLEDVAGATKMTMTHAGIPADSPGAMGWTMALDKLMVYVDSQTGS